MVHYKRSRKWDESHSLVQTATSSSTRRIIIFPTTLTVGINLQLYSYLRHLEGKCEPEQMRTRDFHQCSEDHHQQDRTSANTACSNPVAEVKQLILQK